MNFWHTTVVQVKIITLEITFGATPSPPPSPVPTAAPGDTDATTKKDTDATTKKDTDATTKKDTDATTKKDTDATAKKDTDATTKKDTAATTQRGTFSPQMTTKIVSPSRTFKPPVAGPSTGTRCPARTLINKCKIKCGTVTCSGGLGNALGTSADNGVSTTTWKVPEGPDGATCTLTCPEEDNLKETTKCSKNAEGKMEWSLPAKLKAKCEESPAASSAPSPTPAASSGPSPTPSPGQAPASTERTCPAKTLINKCKINCETTSCKGNTFGASNNIEIGFQDGIITTWKLGKGAEGATCNIKCPKADNLDETTKCSLNAATKKMEWSMPEKLKAKCGG